MTVKNIKDIIGTNAYPGRGICVGTSESGKYAVCAYFIMGRSENSRNRVFKLKDNGDVYTEAFDPSKCEDPLLIIYNAVRDCNGALAVTNGDQTDTIYDAIMAGGSFESGLRTREFEPDAPNFTPRISAILNFDGGYSYKMSILKNAANGAVCNRFFYEYASVAGEGRFIHTYEHDGNPLPTFEGEPRLVAIPDDIDAFTSEIWNALDENNKISLYVRYTDLATGEYTYKVLNKNA